ncbi:hypothetical protein Sinac_7107 [Singulisphaera acidiphila DSM 18658]|uniref:Uncharacterized protein n=1 Tax=Singulisphaera acidiphila (strain ATCC BAA-1392 / DSM 18658 / VKM B-2454 / MOB10) TaxID=886293 RepID=L0DRZ1_SINAD|nr:hypothetical protein Sinac_7107 [Singulisphaera acidiphila DSM 18658]
MRLSPHSFRVAAISNHLPQGKGYYCEDVQYLNEHAGL